MLSVNPVFVSNFYVALFIRDFEYSLKVFWGYGKLIVFVEHAHMSTDAIFLISPCLSWDAWKFLKIDVSLILFPFDNLKASFWIDLPSEIHTVIPSVMPVIFIS